MKKTRAIFICILTFLSLLINAFSASALSKEYSWYCVRSGNLQPKVTSEELLINKYGGISIDRSVNDASEKKILYITFDAGYENGNVERILNVLKEEDVTAAFFLLDNIILKNTDLVTRMSEEGHMICNHTKNHKNLCNESRESIKSDIEALERIYKTATGKEMEKYFRFPKGVYSEAALEIVESLGYKSVFWSFAYDDWDNNRQPDKEKAISKILSNTHNGAIILLHPTSEINAEIMPILIKEWRSMGYEFGSLKNIGRSTTE